MRKAFLSVAAVSIALSIALCLALSQAVLAGPAAKTAANPTYQVKIDNFSFSPATLTVPAGSVVTWTNQDDVPHTVVSTDGKGIKSAVLDTDDKFTYTFKTPGSYSYYCSVHPRMTGKVIVK